MCTKLTTDEFIKLAKIIHGNKFSYDSTLYKGAHNEVKIYCNTCKDYFYRCASSHIRKGIGCPKCSGKIHKHDKKTFVKKAKEIHGDIYDYSQVNYINNRTKVQIICKSHNSFEQTPDAHLHGQGCPKCGIESRVLKKLSNTEEFISKAIKIHENIYDYSKIIYKHGNKKVKIICKHHR